MMNLIICEGKTDAIFLSYYLNKQYGWVHNKKESKKPIIKLDDDQEYNVYENNDKKLIIWSIGGCGKFPDAVEIIDEYNTGAQKNQFSKIIYMIDRDQHVDDEKLLDIFRKKPHNQISREWSEYEYKNDFGINIKAQALVLIIPDNEKGALETIFLKAVSEICDESKILVDQSVQFIDSFEQYKLIKYLTKNREKMKAKFATVLNVMYPEKTFSKVDDFILSVNWHDSTEINELFKVFSEI